MNIFCLYRCNLNSTDSLTLFNSYFHVAFVAPRLTPRIFDQIIFESIFDTISHRKYPMINLRATALIRDNSSRIVHKNELVGLESHSNRTLFNGSFELGGIHLGHVDKISNFGHLLGPFSLATLPSQTNVGVVEFVQQTDILRIAKTSIHDTAHTSPIPVHLTAID